DGLMGLGYDSVSGISNATKTNANFIDSLNLPGESNVFGFYLSNSVDNTNGSISIGGIDKTKFTGPINYFPVIRKRVWEIDISKMTFNVGGFKGPMSIQSTAIADSGTSNFLLEARVANSVNSAVGARLIPTQSMIYEIDCMALKTGVDVVLSMSGVDFVFPPASYIQEIQLSNNQKACITRFNAGASKISIFGDAFNRAYYTIYDKANHRVGFA
ncbi:aspartic peptidase domain-containing protein, partial [Globomyces pollinis-pini]